MDSNPSTKTRSQVACEYNITERTLRRWIAHAKLDIPKRMILKPKDLSLIYQTFGCPKMSDYDR